MAEKIKTTSFEKSNESACVYEVKDLLIETLDILEARYDKDALTGIPSGIKRLEGCSGSISTTSKHQAARDKKWI